MKKQQGWQLNSFAELWYISGVLFQDLTMKLHGSYVLHLPKPRAPVKLEDKKTRLFFCDFASLFGDKLMVTRYTLPSSCKSSSRCGTRPALNLHHKKSPWSFWNLLKSHFWEPFSCSVTSLAIAKNGTGCEVMRRTKRQPHHQNTPKKKKCMVHGVEMRW